MTPTTNWLPEYHGNFDYEVEWHNALYESDFEDALREVDDID